MHCGRKECTTVLYLCETIHYTDIVDICTVSADLPFLFGMVQNLDSGLDYVLDYGLDFGLDSKLTSRFQASLAEQDSHTKSRRESGDTRILCWCCTVSKSVGNYSGTPL